jgi:type IV secretion system protein VirB10
LHRVEEQIFIGGFFMKKSLIILLLVIIFIPKQTSNAQAALVFDAVVANLIELSGIDQVAAYNSSVSYAQSRVQIVWDIMIRPDGFQINLEGAGGVDRTGMSGQQAKYDENWFEYLKAAGIITLFSIANAKLVETAATYASEESTANIAASNSQLFGQLGGNLISRAMNIQPTLTVDNGTLINIMLNQTLYLPPVTGYPATQRYILE